jgi:hypothetical protein
MFLARIGYLAFPLAVFGTATIASAQSTTTTIEKRGPVKLTPQQRTVIYRTVSRERTATQRPADSQTAIGSPIPPILSPLPDTVYAEIPEVRALKYFYINKQVVLVDPVTSEVVEVIEQ